MNVLLSLALLFPPFNDVQQISNYVSSVEYGKVNDEKEKKGMLQWITLNHTKKF